MDRKEEYLSSCIIVDTETTNVDKEKAEIIELGFAVYSGGDWVSTSYLYKPMVLPIEPEISAVTHIVDEMVVDKPHFQSCVEDINGALSAIRDANGSAVAHNAIYDSTVVNKYDGIVNIGSPWLCTMKLSKHLYGDDLTVKQHNLAYLRYRFKLNVPKHLEHHRASSDAYITGRLLEHLVQEMENRGLLNQEEPYKKQIDEYTSRPRFIPRAPFGKYVGKAWSEIPSSYLMWAINNLNSLNDTDPLYDPDLAHTFSIVIGDRLDRGEM